MTPGAPRDDGFACRMTKRVMDTELDDALLRDARRGLGGPSENPDRGEADRPEPEAIR